MIWFVIVINTWISVNDGTKSDDNHQPYKDVFTNNCKRDVGCRQEKQGTDYRDQESGKSVNIQCLKISGTLWGSYILRYKHTSLYHR